MNAVRDGGHARRAWPPSPDTHLQKQGGPPCGARPADLYFAQQIQALPAKTVVGIFGMAHIPGILAFWDRASTVPLAVLDSTDQGLDDTVNLWLSVHGPNGTLATTGADVSPER